VRERGLSVFPVFVFTRRRVIETPDRILAGLLHLNNFGQPRLSHRARRELAEIIHGLTADAQAGRLPLDGVVIGWPGDGRKPMDAADVFDPLAMSSWNARAFTVAVRVDRSGEQTITRESASPAVG
jgi:hypothetical protein